jgi:hypothetical protein
MPRITSLVLCLCAFTISVSATTVTVPMPRLRAATPEGGALITRALRDSPTVRRLAAEIAASDLIVYVEIGHVDGVTSRATTELVTATASDRFVRVTLSRRTAPIDLIPLLAHELQHAAEIAREPQVRDSASVRALYARIGTDPSERHSFETLQARVIERAARFEALGRKRQ